MRSPIVTFLVCLANLTHSSLFSVRLLLTSCPFLWNGQFNSSPDSAALFSNSLVLRVYLSSLPALSSYERTLLQNHRSINTFFDQTKICLKENTSFGGLGIDLHQIFVDCLKHLLSDSSLSLARAIFSLVSSSFFLFQCLCSCNHITCTWVVDSWTMTRFLCSALTRHISAQGS